MPFTREISPGLSHPPSSNEEFKILSQIARTTGLSRDYMLVLCIALESKEIEEDKELEIIKCLIPKNGGTVSEDICIRLTWLLNTNKISTTAKVELLKWMSSIYHFMETSGAFQLLYECFLGFLQSKEMQPYAAHLVYMLTRKKHVTFRRVKYIFNLIEEYGQQSYFISILRIYIFYGPELFEDEIKDDLMLGMGHRNSFGEYPTLIRNVHHTYEANFSNVLIIPEESSRTGVLLDSCATETHTHKFTPFIQIYKEYRDIERSVKNPDVLTSKNFLIWKRLFLTSRLKQMIQIQIWDHILSSLHEDIDSEDFIEKHLELIRLQYSIPGFAQFSEFFLPKHCCPDVAEVICHEPVRCFKKVSYHLQLMCDKFLTTKDITMKFQWLNCLSKMFCYWVLQRSDTISCDGRLCSESSDVVCSDVRSVDSLMCHTAADEIHKLNVAITFLCESLLVEDCNPFILNQILAHYEMAAIAQTAKEKFFPYFPSDPIFQLSLFSLTSLTLDTLSGLMLRINTILSNEKKNFKTFYNDIKKVFLGGSYRNGKTYISETVTLKKMEGRSLDLKNIFPLHKHPAFTFIIKEYGEKDLNENFLIDPNKRLHLFNYLAENGLSNFIRLLHSTIKTME